MKLPTLDEVREAMRKVRIVDLAKHVSVSENTLMFLRSGKHKNPRYHTIREIVHGLRAMGIDIDIEEEE